MDYEVMKIFVNELEKHSLMLCRAIIMAGMASSERWSKTPWAEVKEEANLAMRYVREGR